MPFLWSHNSTRKVTRTLHSHPHCQQSQNLCKISTFWIWGATSIPRWCIAAREAESSHISTVFCPIRNAVSEGGQLSKRSICHEAKKCTQWFLLGLNILLIPITTQYPGHDPWPKDGFSWVQFACVNNTFPSTMVTTYNQSAPRSWSTVGILDFKKKWIFSLNEYSEF